MGFMRGGSSPPPIVYTPPPPTVNDAEIQAAKAKEAELLRKQRGRKSTWLTGGEGVTEEAPLQRKTLLGE